MDIASVDELLTNADTALYRAKEGRGTFRLYEPAMAIRIAERRVLEQGLRSALALHQLVVFYQPIFDCATLEVTGFEAPIERAPRRPGDAREVYFNPAKAKRELGWEAEVSLIDGMRRTYDYFREREKLTIPAK